MARKKRSELTAGIFVILGLVVLIGMVVWLGGSGLLRPAKQVAVLFRKESAGGCGLVVGSFVKIGDDQVGKISRIRFEPTKSRTFYYAEIERGDFKVHGDGSARVTSGLVGGAELGIVSRGSEQAPLADEDNPIEIAGGLNEAIAQLSSAAGKLSEAVKTELSAEDPDALLGKIHLVMDKLKSAAANVATIAANIKTETDRKNGDALLTKIHTSMDDINKMTSDARPKVSETLTDFRAVAGKFRKYTDEDIAEILAKLREANTNILKISKDFSTVSGQVKETVLMNRENVDELIDNMVAVSTNLKAASKEIRRNPWRLLYEPDEKELRSQNIYDAARAFSDGASQLDQAVAKLTGLAKAHPDGMAADDPTFQQVRKHLSETFEKFTIAEQALWKELPK